MFASSTFSRLLQTAICISLATVVCVGCGKPKVVPATETPAQAPVNETSKFQFRSAEEAQQLLAGLWLGKAAINEDTLGNLLAQLPQPQQQTLLKEAQTFVSTQMAMQLATDGSMETAVEVTPMGAQPIQGQTVARWSVINAQGNQVVVQVTQQNENGQAVTSQTAYTVSPDGNRIAMQANMESALAQCEPLIYLDRQVDERMAQSPNANLVR